MAKCLVTGGAGFIGSHLTEHLLNAGHTVTVLDNYSTGESSNLDRIRDREGLRLLTGSITDPVLLAEAARGQDCIYHLAAAVGVKLVADNPVRTIETNIYPTESLLRLAAQGNQRFFLHRRARSTARTQRAVDRGGGPGFRRDDETPLGLRLLESDRRISGSGIPPVVRTAGGDRAVFQRGGAKAGRPLRHGDSAIRRQGDERGADRGVRRRSAGPLLRTRERCRPGGGELTNHPEAAGKVFNIGSDRPVSIRELAEKVAERVGVPAQLKYVPYGEAYGADFEDVRRRVPDLGRLERILGWKPSRDLTEILDDIIAAKRAGNPACSGPVQEGADDSWTRPCRHGRLLRASCRPTT